MTPEKVKKNLFLPDWLAGQLDAEGEKAGGPGLVAGAALWSFLELEPAGRIEALQGFQRAMLDRSYGQTAKRIVKKAAAARQRSPGSRPIEP